MGKIKVTDNCNGIAGLKVIEPTVFGDARGYFMETYNYNDEYFRDVNKGLEINKPKNYFPKDNPNLMPIVTWRGTANIVFSNWLNYCVYQNTPYDLNNL